MNRIEPLRILIATASVVGRSGTDLYTRDLALGLLRRGLVPVVYASHIGPLAQELRNATIAVVNDPASIGARPDVIHGHHALETLAALARFRDVPALFVCHDSISWHSIPPKSSRIRAWIAVDYNCRDRMAFEHGVPEHSIEVFTNAVDLARFKPRSPLPQSPRRALVFNNAAVETGYVANIRKACAQRGIAVDVAGEASGRATSKPEDILPAYDLVFARARCALEAAAVGTAVILCDQRGLGGMLDSKSLDATRALNFGIRTLQRPFTPENLGAEIDRYDAEDAAAVTARIRASAGIDVLVDQYVSVYERLAPEPAAIDAAQELREFGETLARMTPHIPLRMTVSPRRMELLNARILARPVAAMRWLKKRLAR